MKKILVIILLITLTVGCIEQTVIDDAEVVYPTFNIVSDVNVSSGFNPHTTWNELEKEFAIPAISYNVSHTIRDMDNNAWTDPRLEFTISLVPRELANADDAETIYFRVGGLHQRIDVGSGSGYRLITKSGGWYRATWRSGSNIWYEKGNKKLNVLHKENLSLDFEVNRIGMSFLKELDFISLQTVFYNAENTWSETHNVTFRVVLEYAL